MKGTRFLPFAYIINMESVLFMFLIFYIGENPALGEKLRAFLKFYRENRDLFAAFMQNEAPMSETKPSETKEQTKSRPREEDGISGILEEYLNRL